MQIDIEIKEDEIRQILSDYIATRFGVSLDPKKLHIEVRSKKNYKSEWEVADFRMKANITGQ